MQLYIYVTLRWLWAFHWLHQRHSNYQSNENTLCYTNMFWTLFYLVLLLCLFLFLFLFSVLSLGSQVNHDNEKIFVGSLAVPSGPCLLVRTWWRTISGKHEVCDDTGNIPLDSCASAQKIIVKSLQRFCWLEYFLLRQSQAFCFWKASTHRHWNISWSVPLYMVEKMFCKNFFSQ